MKRHRQLQRSALGPCDSQLSVLEEHDIALCTRPDVDEVELFLLDGIPPMPFGSVRSTYYDVVGDGVVPTEKFCRLYEDRQLDLDLDGSIEGIETHVDLLVPFIEQLDPEQQMRLMSCWAMSTDRRLGLKHVHRSLKAALEELRRPLKLILREQAHDPSPGTAARARKYALAAACKLQRLSADWSAPALDHWHDAKNACWPRSVPPRPREEPFTPCLLLSPP